MSELNPAYRIFPGGRNAIVYEEAGEASGEVKRELRFPADAAGEWFDVRVPAAELWAGKMPAWAKKKRAEIVARLRAAKCVVWEDGVFATRATSPGGVFRVEVEDQMDDRGCPLRTIRVVINAGDKVVVGLDGAALAGRVDFPAGMEHGVVVPFSLRGVSLQIGINVATGMFWFHPTEERPLAELAAALLAMAPVDRRIGTAPPAFRRKSTMGSFAMLLGCMLFVAAGVWQVADGKTAKDRWIGGVAVLFFGACGVLPVMELLGKGNTAAPSDDYQSK